MVTKYSDYQPIYKLIVLTFFTFGIYLIYWEYKTWKFLKKENFNINKLKNGEPERLTGNISPILRVLGGFIPILNIVLLYQLFEWSSIYADINHYYTELTGFTLLGVSLMCGVINLILPFLFIIIVLPFALTQNILNKVIEKKSRKPIKKSFYLAELVIIGLIIILMIICFVILFFAPKFSNETSNINKSHHFDRLSRFNEYTEGTFYFVNPYGLNLEKITTIDNYNYFELTKDDDLAVILVGDTTTKSNSEYFNDFYNDAYITLTEGFDVPYINIEKKNSVTQQGFTYIKKTIYFKENNLIWSTIVVFDDHSDKIAGIGYYSPFEKHKYYEVYLNNILDSITFT